MCRTLPRIAVVFFTRKILLVKMALRRPTTIFLRGKTGSNLLKLTRLAKNSPKAPLNPHQMEKTLNYRSIVVSKRNYIQLSNKPRKIEVLPEALELLWMSTRELSFRSQASPNTLLRYFQAATIPGLSMLTSMMTENHFLIAL